MELMVRGGDYLPDGRGGFRRAEGDDELLQRVLWKLSVRRGSFPFLPELGSRLYLLPREKPGAWEALARQYAVEALRGEAELEVTGVTAAPAGAGALEVPVRLSWNGEPLAVSLIV